MNKYGDLNSTTIPYYVCYVSGNDAKIKDSKTGEEKLESGSVIGLNTLINTNNSKIIIRNFKGEEIRLIENSSFSLENTIEGQKPVIYGNIYFKPSYNDFFNGPKYRTSCWASKSRYIIENNSNNVDTYYNLDSILNIYEYDENCNRFLIASSGEFNKIELKIFDKQKMRNRYKIQSINLLNEQEIKRLFDVYLNPCKWGFKISEKKVM